MKATSIKNPTRGNVRSGRIRAHILPFLIWAAAVVTTIVLFRQRAERFEILGLAQGQVHQVAATCDGRLIDVHVQLFDRVHQGKPLAEINTVPDDENIQAQVDTASAEVQHLKAELAAMQERLGAEAANREADWTATHRRFSVDVENSKLQVLELMTLIETDRVALDELKLENKIFLIRTISDQNDTAFYERQRAKVRYEVLAKKIKENEALLEQAKKDLEAGEKRLAEFSEQQPQHPSPDGELEVIQKQIIVQEQRIKELRARRTPLVLTSPFDGVVAQVYHRPGEAVLAGDIILTIAEAKPTEVIAYASEDQLTRVREKMSVELIKITDSARIVRSQVAQLGTNIELMPQQLWRNPNAPQWGRPVLITVPAGFDLVPGELVGVRGL